MPDKSLVSARSAPAKLEEQAFLNGQRVNLEQMKKYEADLVKRRKAI